MPTGQLQIETRIHQFQTKGEIELIDLTYFIEDFVQATGIREGRVTVFIPGSTAAIIATEFERGLIEDNIRIIQELIPKGGGYQHDRIDSNAHSHLRSSLFGSEMTIPVIEGRVTLGTWQQIVFVELDVRPRNRKVVFQILGIQN
ncbi:MAG: secondary thiamine-phosphate synthase enzyme YjbQ [Candidatus Kariarchaeaceae archaeon]